MKALEVAAVIFCLCCAKLLYEWLKAWCSNPDNDPAASESPTYLQDPYDDGRG